jgi:hypothetical protein
MKLPVNYSFLMEVLKGTNEFCNIKLRPLLLEFECPPQMEE